MKYSKSMIALCVGSALAAGATNAQSMSDTKAAYATSANDHGHFVLQLKSQPALWNGNDNRSDYRPELSLLKEHQDVIFNQILAIDPTAELMANTRLLTNTMTIKLDPQLVEQVKLLRAVQAVSATGKSIRVKKKPVNADLVVNMMADTEQNSEVVSYMQPYTGSATAGAGVSIGIVSTGIDYTLEVFGGSGVYGVHNGETPPVKGSYLDAWEANTVGPTVPAVEDDPNTDEDESADAILGYDGFPTNVVAGGWDFYSENWGNDGNPIESNIEVEFSNGYVWPTGLGTELASIVHQLAPGAEIHAYKVFMIKEEENGEVNLRFPDFERINQSIEHALDPNQDGDISDHLDVLLLDSAGAAAFYHQFEQSGSSASKIQDAIQRASALGLTIVTNAGYGGHQNSWGEETETNIRNWISWEGSAPAAITVGSTTVADDGTVVPAKFSPKGPVRGSFDLKPELMSLGTDVPVAMMSKENQSSAKVGTRSDANVASARIAAAVAVLKAANPEFGSIELKALLANTADHNIKEMDYTTGEVLEQAELIHIGHGVENIDNALASPVIAWNTDNHQPYVQFGFHEVMESKKLIKNITLRNFSDAAQTYELSYNANGEKDAQQALSIMHPSSVSVPAKSSVTISVEMMIDGTKLPEWPLTDSEKFTDENFKATELNGYFTFSSAGNPDLNMGWMVQARPGTDIVKAGHTVEYPYSLGWNHDLGRTEWVGMEWARSFYPHDDDKSPEYKSLVTSFVNDSNTPTTFVAYPVVKSFDNPPKYKNHTFGHKIKAVGANVLQDARCDMGGKKLSIAVNFWQPAQDTMANWSDKMGTPLFYYDIFSEDVVKELGFDEAITPYWASMVSGGEMSLIGQPYVDIDENGKPATFYIDYEMEYDRTNPDARRKKSILPVKFSNNGKNVVSEVCLGELAHHEISDAPDDDSLPAMVAALDEFGNPIGEKAQCDLYSLEWFIENGYFEAYGPTYCTTSTGLWDSEGYALDQDGNRLLQMVENTERGIPGVNELEQWFDQNLGFHIETDRDVLTDKGDPIVQFNPVRGGYFVSDVEVCTESSIGIGPSTPICEISDIDHTVKVGFSKTSDDNPIETAMLDNEITLQPGEEVTIAALTADVLGLEPPEFMVLSTNDDFSVVSPVGYVDEDGSSAATVREGQMFSVMEGAEVNTVVGKIELDTSGLFSTTESLYIPFTLSIMNALPGTPFDVNQETQELYVVNPDALDYENVQELTVLVQAQSGRVSSKSVEVKVMITNTNDIAPEVDESQTPTTVQAPIANNGSTEVSIDVAKMFRDIEGDSLTYSVAGLPAGMSYANGMITGSTDVEGSHMVTVTASDGVNETSTSFEIMVEDNTTSSSGGSFGGFLLALAGMSLLRRRK